MEKKGQCFEKAVKAIIDFAGLESEWCLVHGVVTGTAGPHKGQQFSHAWIENDHIVWDVESEQVAWKEHYYKFGKIKDTVKYTKLEAITAMLESEHYGPWDSRFYRDDLVG